MEKKKNLWVIPTDKPSRLRYFDSKLEIMSLIPKKSDIVFQNIYITNSEEIKEGDWFLWQGYGGEWFKEKCEYMLYEGKKTKHLNCNYKTQFKVILTTDLQLIADGVQAIDNEFLEWFVKNPSCESVRVNNLCYGALGGFADAGYKIIIPKEEPKLDLEKEMFELEQELDIPSHLRWHNSKSKKETTLEEAAKNYANIPLHKDIDTEERYFNSNVRDYDSFTAGAIWQQEQCNKMYSDEDILDAWELGAKEGLPLTRKKKEKLFKQFKKK